MLLDHAVPTVVITHSSYQHVSETFLS